MVEKDEWEHSAFTKNLLSGLKEKRADYNDDGVITGSEIGMYLQDKVSLDTDNFQTPKLGRFTTHEGEIIFLSKVEQKKEPEQEFSNQLFKSLAEVWILFDSFFRANFFSLRYCK